MEDRLQDARKMIDEIDDRMAELFVRRMEAVREVARYKKEHGLGITDSSREKENLSKAAARVPDDALRGYYSRFLRSTMDLAKDYQRTLLQGMRVAYAGIPGAYAHAAAIRVFPGCETVPCANFAQAYDMVVKGGSDACVLPLENSAAGVVGQVNDLIFSGPLYICGSVELPVRHVLCAAEGTREEDIRTVVSHPQALQQCAAYIESRHLAVMEYENTAMAARYVAQENDPALAAICAEDSAVLYGLKVLSRRITSSNVNTTRFAVLSAADSRISSGQQGARFALMFTVRNEAGSLARAISVIGAHGYNMLSLRSRPMKELLWRYYFFVEIEGDVHNAEGAAMLDELSFCCDRLKMCGEYMPIQAEVEGL